MSTALNYTDQGKGKAPLHCASVQRWPGGNLSIKLTAGVFVPVNYVLTVAVKGSKSPSEIAYPARQQQVS